MNYFVVKWQEGESVGYNDLLTKELFLNDAVIRGVVHKVRGPDGGLFDAKCDIANLGATAVLDYGRHEQFNRANDMLMGKLTLLFRDSSRGQVDSMEWEGDARRSQMASAEVLEESDSKSMETYSLREALQYSGFAAQQHEKERKYAEPFVNGDERVYVKWRD